MQTGNDKIEVLIRDYGKDIYSFCMYLTGNRDEADDLYQQTFLVALEKNSIDMENNPKSYLLSIAVNIRNNNRRKLLWRKEKYDADSLNILENISDDRPTAEEEMIIRDRNRMIRQAVSELPEKMRQVVILFYTEELPISQIASILHTSEGTVKSRLHYAKKTLKGRLEKYE